MPKYLGILAYQVSSKSANKNPKNHFPAIWTFNQPPFCGYDIDSNLWLMPKMSLFVFFPTRYHSVGGPIWNSKVAPCPTEDKGHNPLWKFSNFYLKESRSNRKSIPATTLEVLTSIHTFCLPCIGSKFPKNRDYSQLKQDFCYTAS